MTTHAQVCAAFDVVIDGMFAEFVLHRAWRELPPGEAKEAAKEAFNEGTVAASEAFFEWSSLPLTGAFAESDAEIVKMTYAMQHSMHISIYNNLWSMQSK